MKKENTVTNTNKVKIETGEVSKRISWLMKRYFRKRRSFEDRIKQFKCSHVSKGQKQRIPNGKAGA